MIWPSPKRPTLSVQTGTSFVDLPVRHFEDGATQELVQEVRSAASAPPVYAPGRSDPEGRMTLVNSTPPTSYPVDGADIELTSSREEVCEMVEGDPSSCIWRQQSRSGWNRKGWRCEVEASYRLEVDSSGFRLQETLRALEGKEEVFSRTVETQIPRDFV